MSSAFGMVTGPAYTIPYCIAGLVMGALADVLNRKWLLAITFFIGGISSLATASFDSFGILIGMRVLHAIMNSATNPLTFSLVSDYVHPDRRNTVNSILGSSSYIGTATSSLAIMLIRTQGWRFSFGILGLLSVAVSAVVALFVKEVPRG